MFAIFVVAVLACGALSAPADQARVIGGTPAKKGQIPYIISLRAYGGHSCGGSILDDTHIVTAAHCVYGSQSSAFSIQYGVLDSNSNENVIDITDIKIHEDFVYGGEFPNDIAILKLAKAIEFGSNVKPTSLPSGELNIEGDSVTARLSGWGVGDHGNVERYLLTAEFPLFNDAICKRYLDRYNPTYHVCAGDLDGSHKQCSGDSGGPLYADGVQHGIVSWSYKPCTITNRPGVFTKVAKHLDWIQKTLSEL